MVSPGKDKFELYKLDVDTEEKNNVIDQYSEKADHLKAKYQAWRNDMEIPMGDIKNKK